MLDSKDILDSDEKLNFFSSNSTLVGADELFQQQQKQQQQQQQQQQQESQELDTVDGGKLKKILTETQSNSSSTGSMDYVKSTDNEANDKGEATNDRKIDDSLEVTP